MNLPCRGTDLREGGRVDAEGAQLPQGIPRRHPPRREAVEHPPRRCREHQALRLRHLGKTSRLQGEDSYDRS